jgi:hypothetical protein
MEEEAIITAVRSGPKTTIGESLELEFLYVGFRVLRRFKYEDKVARPRLEALVAFIAIPSTPVTTPASQPDASRAFGVKAGRFSR